MQTVLEEIKKDAGLYNDILIDSFSDDLLNIYIPEIKKLIMTDYDSELVAVVTNRRSKTNPLFYRDEFETALTEFEYIVKYKDYITLRVPDINNFPWSKGRLKVILNILEGSFGIYVEVSEQQYIQMYNKKPRNIEPYDKTVPMKERIYLLRYTTKLKQREKEVFGGTKLVRYPFSNSPPIRLFEPTIKFVESRFEEWLEESVFKVTKEYYKKERI